MSNEFYFAYGSNLHLEQMARRCPHSKYIGRGILHDYAWQINERGYANIIAKPKSTVEGLVYELNEKDEAVLYGIEGVASGSYAKEYHSIDFYPAPASLYYMLTADIVEQGGPAEVLGSTKQGLRGPKKRHLDVLVYISRDFTKPGKPHDEYIDRINLGVEDAEILGASISFFSRCVRPYVPDRKV